MASIKADQVKYLSVKLIQKIQKKLPDDVELEVALLGLTYIPSHIIYKWYKECILPLKTLIDNRDENILKTNIPGSVQIMSIFNRVWDQISDDLKDKIWVTLKIILKLYI